MGFFDRLFKGELFSSSKTSPFIAELTIDKQKFLPSNFEISFKQDLDERNRPISQVYGGVITLTLKGVVDNNFKKWMTNPGMKKDGQIRLYPNNNMPEEGAYTTLDFKDAKCVLYKKEITQAEEGYNTILGIVPNSIVIGNEIFERK